MNFLLIFLMIVLAAAVLDLEVSCLEFDLLHLKISELGLKAAIGLLLLSSFSGDVRVVEAVPPSAPGGTVDG